MTALAIREAEALPACVPAPPALSPALRARAERGTQDQRAITKSLLDEAARAIEAIDASAAQMTHKALRDWMFPLTMAVRNPPPSRDDFDARVAAALEACLHEPAVPAHACTRDALRRALAEWKFWPSAAEVRAHLRTEAMPAFVLRHQLAALRFLPIEREPVEGASAPLTAQMTHKAGGAI